jgi:hypothetical protein
MMRSKRTLCALLAAVTVVAGCDDFLDVNTDPNAPQQAPVDITLPAVQAVFSTGVLGSFPATMSAEWTQQLSWNSNTRAWGGFAGFARYDKYEMRAEDSGALWDRIYATVLRETKDIMTKTAADEEWAYHAIAKIMHAWTLSVATDVWGPIPNTNALDPNVPQPKYDEQKAVYADIQRLLSEAIVDLEKPNFPSRTPSLNDLLYSGDLVRWLKLAHTLQAEMHLHQIYAPGEVPRDRATKVLESLAKGFTSNLDDADFRYPGNAVTGTTPRVPQPWNIARTVTPYKVSQFYVDLLLARNDPRLPITADRVTANVPASGYRGHKNGDPAGPDAQFSRVANFFAHDTASFNWLSYSQAKFMEAEAQLVAGNLTAANAAYRAGIQANMEKLRVPAAQITTYLAARPALTAPTALAEIMREKYIANFLKFEAWNDWRRTGFPLLTPVAGAVLPGIPQRFPNPSSELIDNAANIQATGIPNGTAGMTTKVWWATTGPR